MVCWDIYGFHHDDDVDDGFFALLPPQRSHIFQTITSPSESVLNELRTVEVCFSFFLAHTDICTYMHSHKQLSDLLRCIIYFLMQEMKRQCDEKRFKLFLSVNFYFRFQTEFNVSHRA